MTSTTKPDTRTKTRNRNRRSGGGAMRAGCLLLALGTMAVGGCIGGRFDARTPAAALDPSTRTIVDALTAQRSDRSLPAPTLVPDLRTPAIRGAQAAARGDLDLKGAAQVAALAGVSAAGRHVWSFAAQCTDVRQFHAPPMALQQRTLLLGAAVVTAPGGHAYVMMLVADAGPSALRAEQMGGGPGGANPPLQTYAHPSVASGPCGETWPAAPRLPL